MTDKPQANPEPVLFSDAMEKAIAEAEAVDWKAAPTAIEYKVDDSATISVSIPPKRTDDPQP